MLEELNVARGIVLNMSDPAILLDRDLRFVCHSAAYALLIGLRPRALLRRLEAGESPFELLGGDPDADAATARSCLESGKAMQFAEQRVTNAEGTELTAYVTYLPVTSDAGEPIGVIQFVRDVSAEARVQVRYRELLEAERLRAENLEREVEKRTHELTCALEEVTRLSRVDPLTSLLNRRAFTELAEQSLKMARRHKRKMGLLIGDLDHFKKVNDTFGHQTGDQLLVAVAGAMGETVRDSDPVARFGGEEFVVLLTETAGDSVCAVGERLRRSIEEMEFGQDGPSPTMSIGMALYPDHGDTLDELISHADQALYRAKNGGRNRAVMYESALSADGLPVHPPSRREVLVVGSSRRDEVTAGLGDSYVAVFSDSDADALALCRRTCFEVVLADHDSAEDGVEFLRRSLRFRPESLRLLAIDSKELFLELRGSNLARIDSFLLRSELGPHIAAAIDDGLARREHDRHKLLLASDSVQRLFSSRLADLEDLIERRDFSFAYQPIVDPRTGEVYAYEALCRANHPVFCNAMVLFEAAVQSGTLWQLGRVTRKLAIDGIAQLPEHVKLFVNLHPGEVDDPELIQRAERKSAHRIVFEITERAAIPDLDRFRETSRALATHGYQFAIDDLGAGYASLNAVALLAPEYIKIDMTMIRGIDKAPRRALLIGRMVDFANDIGIKLIAEGIETADEAAAVAKLGCHLAQGYYFGRPRIR